MSTLPGNTPIGIFKFGDTQVEILEGNILTPGVEIDAIVSTDDNHLTMGSGVSAGLREAADSPCYVHSAQVQCPVKAGTVVVTKPYGLASIPSVRCVLHGTAIDYDTGSRFLKDRVRQTTANCLETAEDLRLKRVLFPAVAAGSGGLKMRECAHQMCTAIKAFLAQERLLEKVYIILWLPKVEGDSNQAKIEASKAKNREFLLEASRVLDTPYDPVTEVRQSRDFYGRQTELAQLEAIVAGQEEDERGKRHAVILGGPRIGKRALLDQLFRRARASGGTDRYVARLTFGSVHENTPKSFIYRKLVLALSEFEEDQDLRKGIRSAYENPDLDCEGFLAFLESHTDRYPEVVYLVERLPRLLQIYKAKDASPGIVSFWSDLDRLQSRVRFVYTARDEVYEELKKNRLEPFTETFRDRIAEIRLTCLTDAERRQWVDGAFKCYLGYTGGAPSRVHQFVADEAGQHPYLIGLACHALVTGLKRDDPLASEPFDLYPPPRRESFLEATRSEIERHRDDFFVALLNDLSPTDLEEHNLRELAQAVATAKKVHMLLPTLGSDDVDQQTTEELHKLMTGSNPRLSLDPATLQALEQRGYLVQAADRSTAQFMAPSFATWLEKRFELDEPHDDQLDDVLVTLVNPTPDVITTLFGKRDARMISAQKRLLPEVRERFMVSFRACINSLLHGVRPKDPAAFDSLEQVGSFLSTHFLTNAIKDYLEHVPEGAAILLAVDDALKDIPWELMLETAYASESPYPFLVGRRIVSQQMPQNIRPAVRGGSKVRALLIGNPTDDLPLAEREVEELATQLLDSGRFQVDEDDMLIGSERCQWLPLLNALNSGRYGLIHYSGHSKFDGTQSAWQLKDAKITTALLTDALQKEPPAMVVSSSCESAAGEQAQQMLYENQTFDLPSAFLQAGVQTYVGTLWSVGSSGAYSFIREFYRAFLGGHALGECVRDGKKAISSDQPRTDRLAFVLYGDPQTRPGDLFPAMQTKEGT